MKTFFRVLKIIGLTITALLILYIGYTMFVKWQLKTGRLVIYGDRMYTKKAFDEIVGQIGPQYKEVPAKNTPEEVYTNFRSALINGDKERALGFIREQQRAGYREAFKDEAKFDKWVRSLPEKLILEKIDGNDAYYKVDYGTKLYNGATLRKNVNGIWEIETI